jgi:hypothetical protein
VDLPGTTVRLEETQPGGLFCVGVQFPVGFERAPGQTGQVAFKSNHPKYPVVRVPVSPSTRPTVSKASPETPPIVRAQ